MVTNTEVFTSIISGDHGRERRLERNIEKIDLKRAKRYGMAEPSRHRRIKYTYGGIVFIYDPIKNCEVTSWKLPIEQASDTSGTKVFKPTILSRNTEADKQTEIHRHNFQTSFLHVIRATWKSHSVLVVDMSGSMRKDDISGARCRSDGVW